MKKLETKEKLNTKKLPQKVNKTRSTKLKFKR